MTVGLMYHATLLLGSVGRLVYQLTLGQYVDQVLIDTLQMHGRYISQQSVKCRLNISPLSVRCW